MTWGLFESDPFSFSPLLQLRSLQDEMNKWFENGVRSDESAYPALNLWADGEKAILLAEVPGLSAEDIEVTISGSSLNLKGTRKARENSDEISFSRKERYDGDFSRSVELPYPVEQGAVKASYRNGRLEIVLPRAEEHKPKKIQIN